LGFFLYEEAMQVAYGMSVVVLIYLFVPEKITPLTAVGLNPARN
jgi:hypothetical protein